MKQITYTHTHRQTLRFAANTQQIIGLGRRTGLHWVEVADDSHSILVALRHGQATIGQAFMIDLLPPGVGDGGSKRVALILSSSYEGAIPPVMLPNIQCFQK